MMRCKHTQHTRNLIAAAILLAGFAAMALRAEVAPVAPAGEKFFDGAQDAASREVMRQAAVDIEKYRKGDLGIELVGQDGRPVAGNVTVDLTRHQFNFGASMFGLSRKADGDPMKRAGLQALLDIFNQVVVVDHWYNPFGEIEDKQPAKDVAWALANNMRMRYHAILYEEDRDFIGKTLTQEQYWRAFEERFKHVVDVTKGMPAASSFDVINETLSRKYWNANNPDSFYRKVPDYPDMSKPDLIVRAFSLARKYLPGAKLTALEAQLPSVDDKIYNEIIGMWKAALAAGADIDYIGTQCHFFDDGQPFQPWARKKKPDFYTMAEISKGLDLQKALNKPVEVTEFTGPSRNKLKGVEANKKIWTMSEAENSAWQINFYKLVFSKPYIIGLTRWNLIDCYCGRSKDGGILTEGGEKHQIYNDLKKLIKEEWHTRVVGTLDANGVLGFRGFYGDYRIEVAGCKPVEVTLTPGSRNARVVLEKL